MAHADTTYTLIRCTEKDILGKNGKPEHKLEEMLHEPNLENILQNNWPEPFKNVKIKEKLKGLRSYPRVQFTKEIRQPNIMCNPGFEF